MRNGYWKWVPNGLKPVGDRGKALLERLKPKKGIVVFLKNPSLETIKKMSLADKAWSVLQVGFFIYLVYHLTFIDPNI